MNKVILVGRLGQDPEIRNAGDTEVVNISLATSEIVKGEKKAEWHKLVFFGKTAKTVAQYCQKGSQLLIEGRLQTRSWDDKGVKKYTTEIICSRMEFMGSKSDNSGNAQQPKPPSADFETGDDDIPF